MTAKTATPTVADVTASLIADLGGLPKRTVKARPSKPLGAADWRRTVDLAIIIAAGDLVTELVPEKHRDEVANLIANQLHHLSTPALGWPSTVLPTPDRSDWR